MGTKLFGVDIARIVNQAIGRQLVKITFKKRSDGAPTTVTGPLATSFRSYTVRGFEDPLEVERLPATAVNTVSRVISILGDSLPRGVEPAPGDRIVYLGSELEIVGDGVSSDPARALYTCGCRG